MIKMTFVLAPPAGLFSWSAGTQSFSKFVGKGCRLITRLVCASLASEISTCHVREEQRLA